MITAIHTMVYSDDPTATRAFFKDVLRWPFVSEGAQGDGAVGGAGTGGDDPAEWLIFGTGRSELGVHPTSGDGDGGEWSAPKHHWIAVMCDDVDATVAELAGRGAEFAGAAQDMGFGRGVVMHVPGADDMLLYRPHHATAYDLD
ncbi:VOC family protein [Nocardioides sp. LHG3406-4]|uniref:VOC family protein n=1 Tax=Nocardioides sp. LHG3406-4 TaxID=2804575 RepID=UPI003CF64A80